MSNRLTIKGQVTIPKNVRDFLGLTMGTSAVEFFIDNDGSVRVRKAVSAHRVQMAGQSCGKNCSVLASRNNASHCDRVLAMLSGSYV